MATNVNKKHRESLSQLEKIALFVTERVGTMGFFFIIFSWTILWLGWNIFSPKQLKFDPFPAFVLWLFISNLIQLHLMPLIMIGQNLQGRHSEIRSEIEFETSEKVEKQIEIILQKLEDTQKSLDQINKKLNKG